MMVQSPPPYVPVVEYVLRALEHPPFMYVSKLAACCTMLFLTRENPELLQALCYKWALRFRQDRTKLITYIRNRASYCFNSPDVSTELDASERANSDENNDIMDVEGCKDMQRNEKNEEVLGGMRCCDTDVAVEHLLSILNTLVPMYFSWNWHRADYVIQINKEYEAYVREFILPVCTALAPEEGVDDEERTPWLLPPHTYLDPTQSTSGFYSPTAGDNVFPPTKLANAADTRHGFNQHAGSVGGASSLTKSVAPPGTVSNGAPTVPESADCSGSQNQFTNKPIGRKSFDRHTGVVAVNQQPKFSPLHPTFSSGNYKDLLLKNSSLASAAGAANGSINAGIESTASGDGTAVSSTNATQSVHSKVSDGGDSSGTVSVPAMSPNATSAGVFNALAVYGLRFLTLSNYNAALRHNTRGLVTIFHAKYSVRSNEVIEAFQKITAKRLLNPMPTIAVVYAVAEPELSTLYKVSWFPTIVYTPPLSCQLHYHQPKCGVKSLSMSQTQAGCEGGRDRHSLVAKRQSKLSRQLHSHLPHHSRRGAKGVSVTQPQSVSSYPLSGSDSLLDMAPTAFPTPTPAGASAGTATKDVRVLTSNGGIATGTDDGGTVHHNEERTKLESTCRDTAAPESQCDSEMNVTTTTAAMPLQALRAEGKVRDAAETAGANSPFGAMNVPAATSTDPGPFVATNSRPDGSCSLQSGVSGPLSPAAPMASTSTEPLFGISTEDTAKTPELQLDHTPMQCAQHDRHHSGSAENSTSLISSVEDHDDLRTPQSPPPSQVTSNQQQQQPSHYYQSHREPLLSMVQHDGHVIYPLRGDLTVPALVEWISSRGASVPRLGKLRDVSACLKSIRREEKFKRYRELHSAVVTLRRLQGQGKDLTGSGSNPSNSSDARTKGTVGNKSISPQQQQQRERPLFIFLGGGMAAGKTTAVAALAKSSWWQGHKEQSVVVNADEFKLPLECELSSAEAHKHSTRAAENLLVKAVNQGRSIVLDGTMMWKPFVQQVVNMIRVAHLTLFKQGPGYDPKTKVEQYFLAKKKRKPALSFPYKIIFLGITVDVETAVPRGFLRKFSTNRGVPISMQLRSFKMFSENFADYVSIVDETTLYNNNIFVDLAKGELPPVMAECNAETNNKLVIYDEAAFQQFMKQQQINENADNVTQVYASSPVMADSSLTVGDEKTVSP